MFHLEVVHLYPPDILFSLDEGCRHMRGGQVRGGGSLCHIKGEKCAQFNLKDLMVRPANALVKFPLVLCRATAAPFRKCQML